MRFRRLQVRGGFFRGGTTDYLLQVVVDPGQECRGPVAAWVPRMPLEESLGEFPRVRPERVADLVGPAECVPLKPREGESQGDFPRVPAERRGALVAEQEWESESGCLLECGHRCQPVPWEVRWVLAVRWDRWEPDFPVDYQTRPRPAAEWLVHQDWPVLAAGCPRQEWGQSLECLYPVRWGER